MLAPYRQKVIEYTKPLTVWQKLYFFAFFIMLLELISGSEPVDLTVAGLVALAALSIETWPKFVVLWESILGRVLIVSSYIIVTNFAIAAASHELNQIVGIDPGNLFYATGFVSILMAPLLIITITIIGMLFYVLFKYLWFFITFFPWLIGLYEKTTYKVDKLPKTTRAVRIVMLPIMFMGLVSLLENYLDYEDNFIGGVTEGFNRGKEAGKELAEKSKTESTDVIDIIETTEDEMKKQDDQNKTGLISVNGVEIHGDGKASLKHRAIAAFVYYIEAFEYSQCEKTDKERVVSIGEYDILAVERDDSDIGYKFSVRPCKLKSYGAESTSN